MPRCEFPMQLSCGHFSFRNIPNSPAENTCYSWLAYRGPDEYSLGIRPLSYVAQGQATPRIYQYPHLMAEVSFINHHYQMEPGPQLRLLLSQRRMKKDEIFL
jgi:hypothetical protein